MKTIMRLFFHFCPPKSGPLNASDLLSRIKEWMNADI